MWSDDGGLTFHQAKLEDLDEVAKAFLQHGGQVRLWLLHGEMGSGKTTFVKAICRALGVRDTMSSPTFAIVNEYLGGKDGKVFHFDFYRIKNETEAYDIGTEDYFYSGSFCFIEWPEKIPSLIPARRAEVFITPENQTHRTIAISVHDGKEEKRF